MLFGLNKYNGGIEGERILYLRVGTIFHVDWFVYFSRYLEYHVQANSAYNVHQNDLRAMYSWSRKKQGPTAHRHCTKNEQSATMFIRTQHTFFMFVQRCTTK